MSVLQIHHNAKIPRLVQFAQVPVKTLFLFRNEYHIKIHPAQAECTNATNLSRGEATAIAAPEPVQPLVGRLLLEAECETERQVEESAR